jgi:hypothetical protein
LLTVQLRIIRSERQKLCRFFWRLSKNQCFNNNIQAYPGFIGCLLKAFEDEVILNCEIAWGGRPLLIGAS